MLWQIGIEWACAKNRRAKIREASRHVVIDAVVAPQDGSGPCRSVTPKKLTPPLTSQTGHYLPMKRVGHPLRCTSVGLEFGPAKLT